MFNLELAKHLAELSKLNFTDEELKVITAEMAEIISLMDKITDFKSELKQDRVEAVSFDDLRKDEHTPSLENEKILFNASQKEKGCFTVPKVV